MSDGGPLVLQLIPNPMNIPKNQEDHVTSPNNNANLIVNWIKMELLQLPQLKINAIVSLLLCTTLKMHFLKRGETIYARCVEYRFMFSQKCFFAIHIPKLWAHGTFSQMSNQKSEFYSNYPSRNLVLSFYPEKALWVKNLPCSRRVAEINQVRNSLTGVAFIQVILKIIV